MNELLQRHGCANVFSIPEGLKELMSDISREVLREQPAELYTFIANYLSCLLITREHGIMAVKILNDLCDCRPTISEHLTQLGLDEELVQTLTPIIQEAIEGKEDLPGMESVREAAIIKEVLKKATLDELLSVKVCQVIRNAYRDYWYRRNLLEKGLKITPEEPWEIAAQNTLELYKKTKPSFSELTRAADRIQAAYRGYHVRRCLLPHLRIQRKYKPGPKIKLPGPPVDIADSREISLGPVTVVKVKKDNVHKMFDEHKTHKLGIKYDPMLTLTHVTDDVEDLHTSRRENRQISFSEPTGPEDNDRPESVLMFNFEEPAAAKEDDAVEEIVEAISIPPVEDNDAEIPEDLTDPTDIIDPDEVPEDLTDTRISGDDESVHLSSSGAEDGIVDELDDTPL